jgi:NitT/TauT family transport system substrate-binding protein
LSEKLYEPRYPIWLGVMNGVDYARWRVATPQDTIRFFAWRLHEIGVVKSDPSRLVAEGTDWRFLNEFKRELKA